MSSHNESRCQNTFKTHDNDINLLKVKKFIDLDNNAYKYFKTYKNAGILFDKTTGWFVKLNCNQFLDYDRDRLSVKGSVDLKTKYKKEISNCKTYKKNKEQYAKEYLNNIAKTVKSKISTKIIKTLKKPNQERINKLSCYIKILIDIANSKNCRNSNFTIRHIIDYFGRFYNSPNQTNMLGAKQYLNYLLTNSKINESDLHKYKKWYKNDLNFSKALSDTINKLFTSC